VIKFVEGDILNTNAALIAHGVAPNDNFGQGLALSLRERWPAMYKDFRHYCQVKHPKSGEVWFWGGAEGVQIANLMTQEAAYGHGEKPGKATLAHVNHALRELRKLIEQDSIPSVALPKLATGVGGLDWQDVKPLIENHLGDLAIDVFVYETYVPANN
jgi:O-acetyl-ADP-ribose deacetylase (regulator of RNase III)